MATVVLRGIEDVYRQLAELRFAAVEPTLQVEVSELSQQKLGWLLAADRDFLSPSGRMAKEMLEAARKGFNRLVRKIATKRPITQEDMAEPWEAVGKAVLDRVDKRLRGGGNDILSQMRKLKAATVKRKGHGVIGYDTGALWRDIKAATVHVRFPAAAEARMLRAAASGSLQAQIAGIQAGSPAAVGYARGIRAAVRGLTR